MSSASAIPQELAQKTANIIDKRLGDLKFKGNLMLIQKETGTNQFCPSLFKCLYEIIYDILIAKHHVGGLILRYDIQYQNRLSSLILLNLQRLNELNLRQNEGFRRHVQ